MNDIANDLLPFLPAHYRPKVMLVIVLSPHITRALYSIMAGGGLSGILRAIWLGTNTPKQLVRDVEQIKSNTINVTKP